MQDAVDLMDSAVIGFNALPSPRGTSELPYVLNGEETVMRFTAPSCEITGLASGDLL